MDVELYQQKYFELDYNIPFLDLIIYPIEVKDYYSFFWAVDVLKINKNKDPEGIVFSNLDYLLHKMQQEREIIETAEKFHYFEKLITIIELVFNVENGIFCPACGFEKTSEEVQLSLENLSKIKDPKAFDTMYNMEVGLCKKCKSAMINTIQIGKDEKNKSFIRVKNTNIYKSDFDELRKIVCHQNILDYDDEYIDSDLEQALQEVEELKNKNVVFPSLEKQMCCIVAGSGYIIDQLKTITLRKFTLLLKTIDTKLHYEIYKQNENSGAVTFTSGLDHWIYETKKTKFDNIITLDSLKKKMQGVTK
jgi:hypothetical protein